MATYKAAVPLQASFQFRGAVIELARRIPAVQGVSPARVEAIPAGEEFEVPDIYADVFEAWAAPSPGNGNISPSAAENGRIPGLVRVR